MADSKILYGGQAVVEGVMMRGRNFVSCAVRHENGEIELKSESIPKGVYTGFWSKTPFFRALPLLWDTLVLGTRMLMWAANIQIADEMKKEQAAEKAKAGTSAGMSGDGANGNGAAPHGANGASAAATGSISADADVSGGVLVSGGGVRVATEPALVKTAEPKRVEDAAAEEKEPEGLSQNAIYGTLALSLGLGAAIFFALPVLVAHFLGELGVTPFWNNIVEGVIRLGLFLAYLIAIGRIPEIQRVFMYHGAEHKTIAAYEGGAELIPSEVQKFSKEHPRCGTGFMLTVVVVSIIFFLLLGDLPLGLRLISRLALIPFVAAVSYELIRFASQHRNIFVFDWFVVRPSLALQSLTTRQPTDDMIEVAVASFEDVRKKEEALAAGTA